MSHWQKMLHEDSNRHTVFHRQFAAHVKHDDAVFPEGVTEFMGVGIFNVETAPGAFVQIQREFSISALHLGEAFAVWDKAYQDSAPGIVEKALAEFKSRGRR